MDFQLNNFNALSVEILDDALIKYALLGFFRWPMEEVNSLKPTIYRTRHEDVFKDDDVYAYIPAIRRVRRLSGADVCDPMLGSDVIYDDFECFHQKTVPKMTFKMRECEMLVPCPLDKRPLLPKGTNHPQVDWEIRPVYEVEVYANDPDYVYSKRVVIREKQRIGMMPYTVTGYDKVDTQAAQVD